MMCKPCKGRKITIHNRSNLPQRRVGVNKVLTLFGSIDRKEKFVPTLKTFYEMTALTTFDEVAACEMDMEFSDFVKENVKLDVLDQAWLE